MSDDLDFDELDKAVNSLMGGVTDKEVVPKSKMLDINTTLAPGEAPSYKQLGEAAKSIGSEAIDKQEKTVSLSDNEEESVREIPATLPPEKPAKTKPTGRFMDVVHPSSDMKAKTAKVSHEGMSIAEPTGDLPEGEPIDTTAGNLPPSQEPELSGEEDTSSNGEPVADTQDLLPASTEPTSEPQTSPFLPDAKVEKRPLGGVDQKPDTGADIGTDAKTEEELVPEPEKPETKQEPEPELDEEPAKKKDDEFSKMDAMAEPAKSLTEVTEHVPEEYKDELLQVEKVSLGAGSEAANTPVPTIASIPKQYQEKPSSGDSTNGAIFDTDNYHKPLAHPTEQKSGWLWVIIIVVLIVVGAGLGAAAYFFGLG